MKFGLPLNIYWALIRRNNTGAACFVLFRLKEEAFNFPYPSLVLGGGASKPELNAASALV